MMYKIALDNDKSIFKLGDDKCFFNLMTTGNGDIYTEPPTLPDVRARLWMRHRFSLTIAHKGFDNSWQEASFSTLCLVDMTWNL
jgi:hypothetical protein